MAGNAPLRHYVVLTADDVALRTSFVAAGPDGVVAALRRRVGGALDGIRFNVVALPSRPVLRVGSATMLARSRSRLAPPPPDAPRRVVVEVEFPDPDARQAFDRALRQALPGEYSGLGANLPIRVAESWCPGEAMLPLFGDGSAAERLIRAGRLAENGLEGQGVNVVIVDRGLNAALLPAGTEIKGWEVGDRKPGKSLETHGSMVARNVLRAAPRARLFDLPILADSTGDVPNDLARMHASYLEVMETVADAGPEADKAGERWVIVNAWSVYNRSTDPPTAAEGNYGANPEHPILKELERMGALHDIVFAAGNCGRFCPDRRCGPDDRGPGRSIHGANSHPDVLTVGAVRVDGLWLGYSAEGPGQPALSENKPDLCAPSQFGEHGDARTANTGSSAASGVAAGVVAALRSGWNATVDPAGMRACLREAARPVEASSSARMGSGILDAGRAVECLTKGFGPPQPIVV